MLLYSGIVDFTIAKDHGRLYIQTYLHMLTYWCVIFEIRLKKRKSKETIKNDEEIFLLKIIILTS